MYYQMLSFYHPTGSVEVKFWTDEYPQGLVYNVDVPIEDGQYVVGEALDAYIMSFAPYGQIERLVSAANLPDPALPLAPPPEPVPPTAEQNKLKASNLLYATDWTQLPDVNLANKAEFAVYRDELRRIATDPTGGDLLWPTKPQSVWL